MESRMPQMENSHATDDTYLWAYGFCFILRQLREVPSAEVSYFSTNQIKKNQQTKGRGD
jgi:hypothetical protein